jgi:CheY-like chemotaxis protein
MKILLIDDSRFQRLANERALAKAGYEVVSSKDGEEGLRLARENNPALILLDMMLPKVSGLDVLRALKSDALTQKIPVVVLTSLSQKNQEKLIDEGAAAYIEKSDRLLENDSAALIEAVAKALRAN